MLRRAVCQGVVAFTGRRFASTMMVKPNRLIAAVPQISQKRYSQVEVFGPFDPPKQLTFKEVEQRVLKSIRAWDRFPVDKEAQLTMEAEFNKDLGFDSLDHVEIMMAVEDEFGFEIPLNDAEKLKSPRDVFKYICEREDVFE